MNFIGIDIGTSTICGIVLNPENKKIDTLLKENDSQISSKNDWEKIQDCNRIYIIVKEILEEFFRKYQDIKGIGFTGQMHGIMYVDKYGNSVSPLITWQDGRGNQMFLDNLSYSAYLVRETGYSVASGFGLVTHYFNLKNNQVPDKASKICTIMDYVIMQLTHASSPKTDFSNAASLGFFNLERMQFDNSAIQNVSIDPEILPDVVKSGLFMGLYKNDVPVYSAIGDNQASILGSIRELRNSILVNVGTSGQISVYSDKYITADTLETRPFPGGGYILVGATLCGGISFNILKNLFEKTIEAFCKNSTPDIDFFKFANLIDPSLFDNERSLIVETLFNGSRVNPGRRGSIKNISMENLDPQNLIAGFFNGVCNELYDFYICMPDKIKKETSILVGSGNAIRKNSLLGKVFEKKFGRCLFIPRHMEEAALGASLSAAVGGQYIHSFMEAGKVIEYIQCDRMFHL